MDRTTTMDRTLLQTMAMLFGIVFLLVGVLGFIPGITSDYDGLTTFDGVGAKLLGIFGVNILENVVHLLYGVAGLAMARRHDSARTYFIGGGAIYLVLWLYGLLISDESAANFVGVNNAADWLHFVLGATMVGIGFLLGRNMAREGAATT